MVNIEYDENTIIKHITDASIYPNGVVYAGRDVLNYLNPRVDVIVTSHSVDGVAFREQDIIKRIVDARINPHGIVYAGRDVYRDKNAHVNIIVMSRN